jgi:hypothetical protein
VERPGEHPAEHQGYQVFGLDLALTGFLPELPGVQRQTKFNAFVLLFLFLFTVPAISVCQNWPKVLIPARWTYPLCTDICYDHGYLVGGSFSSANSTPNCGLLLKTGINGDVRWYKHVGQNPDMTMIHDVTQTADGGWIIAGGTCKYTPDGNPFVMKLNACYEKEWCRIYSFTSDTSETAYSVFPVPGGYIVHMSRGGDLFNGKHVFLFRLDLNGNLIWQQQYALSDPLFLGAWGEHMTLTPDNKFLINGYCYYPDPGTTNPQYLRPLLIKVDSSGTAEWEIPWKDIYGGYFQGMSFRSVFDNDHRIYSCGRHIENSSTPRPGDRPTMMVTDGDGNELAYHDLVHYSWQAVFFTINWFSDSTLALGGGWSYTLQDNHEGVFRVDRSGHLVDSVELLSSMYSFSDAVVSEDDKLFLVSPQYTSAGWRTYAWKLNRKLEGDTIYSQPGAYDYLCPHPIASDTLPLDCDLVTGITEPFSDPEAGRLKVYPNPADHILHVVIPEQLKMSAENPVFNVTTVYRQWGSARLEVYDLFDRRMFTQIVHQPDRKIDFDVTSWPAGMYVVRLVYMGKTVTSEKVMVKK